MSRQVHTTYQMSTYFLHKMNDTVLPISRDQWNTEFPRTAIQVRELPHEFPPVPPVLRRTDTETYYVCKRNSVPYLLEKEAQGMTLEESLQENIRYFLQDRRAICEAIEAETGTTARFVSSETQRVINALLLAFEEIQLSRTTVSKVIYGK